MHGSDTSQRRRMIELLNAKEAELSKSQGERPQLSKKELETETEKERQRSLSRRGFSQML